MLTTLKSIKKQTGKLLSILHPYNHVSLNGSRYSIYDLRSLDNAYRIMFQEHRRLHTGLIDELQHKQFRNVLEVACGTGWNVPNFRAVGLEYYGLDISETAIAVTALRFPDNRYFNLGICDCTMFKDSSFDVVYSSAMLEHIGYHKDAIMEMIRLAKKEVYIVFFEGLTDDDLDRIQFHPYKESEVTGRDKDMFGRKVVVQDHIYEQRKGWYWNRYSKKRILAMLQDYHVDIKDKNNTPFISNETVIVIRKA